MSNKNRFYIDGFMPSVEENREEVENKMNFVLQHDFQGKVRLEIVEWKDNEAVLRLWRETGNYFGDNIISDEDMNYIVGLGMDCFQPAPLGKNNFLHLFPITGYGCFFASIDEFAAFYKHIVEIQDGANFIKRIKMRNAPDHIEIEIIY